MLEEEAIHIERKVHSVDLRQTEANALGAADWRWSAQRIRRPFRLE